MTTGILLAHGSPDPSSAARVRVAAEDATTRCGFPVVAAFLDHDSPVLADAAADARPDDDVRVLPLLLSSAFHARVDVPAAVADLDRDVVLLDPLGHPPALLDHVLRRASGAAAAAVVAAGTRVDAERHAFAAAVAAASARTGVEARALFATGPGPLVVDVVAGTAVVPWLLAPGRLLDSVRERAAHAGLDVVGGPLLDEPLLLDEIARRLAPMR